MKFLIAAMFLFGSMSLTGDVFRIEVDTSYDNFSKRDLKKRVWHLERAVAQLQEKVFKLSMERRARPAKRSKYTCYVSAFGKTYTATKSSETAAKAAVMQKCNKDQSDMFCKEVKCGK